MIIARQSTARIVTIGPVLDADGVAVTDGVVGDLKISKNGGAPAALNGSATLTHRNTGHYSLSLTATDLDTVGSAEIVIDDTVNSCPMKVITVIEEAVYDALYAASALGYVANAPVNVAQFGGSNGTFSSGRPEVNTSHVAGTAQTAKDIGAAVPAAVPGAAGGLFIAGSNAATTAASLTVTNAFTVSDVVVTSDFAVSGSFNLDGGMGISSTSHVAQTGNSYAIVSSGTFGNAALKTLIDTVDDLLDTEVAAIKTDTAAILLDTGTDGVVVASHTTAAKAEINAEVLDVINVDTFAEVGQETPAATNTIRKMLGYMFKAWRNKKTQTSSQGSLFADDATTVDQKWAVTDDGTTTTIGEVTAGP